MQWVQQDQFELWVGKRLPMLFTLLLVALFSIALAELVLNVLTPASKPVPFASQDVAVNATVPAPLKRENFGQKIASLHIFGQATVAPPPPKAAPKPVKQAQIPQAPLNIKLQGVIAYGGGKGIAMIDTGKGETKVYRRGNILDESRDIVLSKVLANKIIIKRNGQLEEVSLPGTAKSSAVGDIPRSTGTPFAPVPPSRLNPQNGNPFAGSAAAASGESSSPQQLSELRDKLLNNPMSLNELISMVPYQEKGKQVGYKISPRKNRALFKQMGLKPGDIVVEINGIQLNSIANSMSLMNELGSVTSLSMQVKRGPEIVPVNINF